jgi:hypothetical protein
MKKKFEERKRIKKEIGLKKGKFSKKRNPKKKNKYIPKEILKKKEQ